MGSNCDAGILKYNTYVVAFEVVRAVTTRELSAGICRCVVRQNYTDLSEEHTVSIFGL
jgi:hypothetical protein